jgi:short-subunit dehydrogenase
MKRPARVVVITGAPAGVGRAAARRFAKRRAHVGLVARDADRLTSTKRDVEQAGGRAVIVPADVADPAQVEAAATDVEKAFGPIDVWVNNAMASVFAPVKEITASEFKRVIEVTFLGCVYGTQAALRRMLPRDSGVIVQVGSALAYRGIPLQAPYCAAKHALQGFCDSLWSELLHDGSHVRVTMVQMPALNTPQFDWVRSRLPRRAQPVPPIYQPGVAAEAIVWASETNRREIFVGLPVISTIWADRIAPRLLDRYLATNGYDLQQTNEPDDPTRDDNLWRPVAGDPGPHGRFDMRSRRSSPAFWMARHRRVVAGAVTIGAAATALMLRRRNGSAHLGPGTAPSSRAPHQSHRPHDRASKEHGGGRGGEAAASEWWQGPK